ncbi:hypothetical protein [Schaalia sp. ZJ1691]|uniref:hypothetical protein n=1 Tax=Schaalia sp. ZJ1691 TaxID=2709404 RepID=UPI0013EE33DC|nr:hypothetical protein [Schaalia sp. ZJ1691]
MHPEWASSGIRLIIFLFFVVFIRAQGTYWLGRATAQGALSGSGRDGLRGKIAAWFNGPIPRKGADLLEKWGLILIPLCFLTVGVQTAVNAGSGVVRLKWRTYTLCMIPGCIAWAFLYGFGMLAVWMSILAAIAGSWWGWAGILTVVLIITAIVVVRRRRSRPLEAPVQAQNS